MDTVDNELEDEILAFVTIFTADIVLTVEDCISLSNASTAVLVEFGELSTIVLLELTADEGVTAWCTGVCIVVVEVIAELVSCPLLKYSDGIEDGIVI